MDRCQTDLSACTGFAVVGEYDDSKIAKSQEEAFGQMLAWLKAY